MSIRSIVLFALGVLLALGAAAIGPQAVQRVKLHFKAREFIHFNGNSNPPKPGTMHISVEPTRYNNFPEFGESICHVGGIRIVLLDLPIQRQETASQTFRVTISGDEERSGGARSHLGLPYFSWSYSDGQVNCLFHDFPFLVRGDGQIKIGDRSFDFNTPTVILINADKEIIYTYFDNHRLALR